MVSLTRATRTHRPTLEGLEYRNLLSTLSWSAPGDGDFGDPANWTELGSSAVVHRVPGPSDLAVVNNGPLTIVSSVSESVGQFQAGSAHLQISGGTFTILNSVGGGVVGTATSILGRLDVNGGGGVAVQAGELDLVSSNGNEIGGAVTLGQGALFTFHGTGQGELDLNAGASLSGTGLFEIASGNVNINTPLSAPSLLVLMNTGAQPSVMTLHQPFTIPAAATMSWTAGTIACVDSGALHVAHGGTLTVLQSTKTLQSGNLSNDGTFNIAGGLTLGATATITNQVDGTLAIQNNCSLVGAGALINGGTLTASANSSGTPPAVNVPVTNQATGTITTSGTVVFGATLTNSGQITIQPSSQISIFVLQSTSFTQTSTGTLIIQASIGPNNTTLFGRLASGGLAALAGGLELVVLPGAPLNQPTTGLILTSSAHIGDFATKTTENAPRQVVTFSYNGGNLSANLTPAREATPGDYDGDGKTDTAVFDASHSQFQVLLSGGGAKTPQFGNPQDVNIPMAGDYDGKGKTNIAVYDQTRSQFFILLGAGGLTPQFGDPSHVNIPIAGDYDGDVKTDLAVYDETAAKLYVLLSGGGAIVRQFGNPAHVNIPIAGDFDGDGKTDVAIYDENAAQFFILMSSGGAKAPPMGNSAHVNIPVAADFNGDGVTDIAIYDQTLAQFFVLLSGGGALTPQVGTPGHINLPLIADYNGDGKTDVAVYDQSTSQFFVVPVGRATPTVTQFGNPTAVNIPIPSSYMTSGSRAQSFGRSGFRSSADVAFVAEATGNARDATAGISLEGVYGSTVNGSAVNAAVSSFVRRSRTHRRNSP
jgi:putative transposon-encoded protein